MLVIELLEDHRPEVQIARGGMRRGLLHELRRLRRGIPDEDLEQEEQIVVIVLARRKARAEDAHELRHALAAQHVRRLFIVDALKQRDQLMQRRGAIPLLRPLRHPLDFPQRLDESFGVAPRSDALVAERTERLFEIVAAQKLLQRLLERRTGERNEHHAADRIAAVLSCAPQARQLQHAGRASRHRFAGTVSINKAQ
ncbi:MAG TPA: hypothetical protein VFN10_18485 [Thermoanaerobaculia bacterium]|nr:hypothetical protein [Thermoanaerobaculia bacterium]